MFQNVCFVRTVSYQWVFNGVARRFFWMYVGVQCTTTSTLLEMIS